MSATRDKARSVLLLPDPPTLPLPLPAELVGTAGFEAIVPACVASVTARQLTADPRARDLGLRAYAGLDDATHRGTVYDASTAATAELVAARHCWLKRASTHRTRRQ